MDSDLRDELERLLGSYLAGALELNVLVERIRPLIEQEGWGVSLDLMALPPEQQERGRILWERLEDLMLQRVRRREP